MTTAIGIGHLVRAMQYSGFGHEEIMALRRFMLDHKGEALGVTKEVGFVDDCYSEDWDDNPCIIKDIYK